MKGKVHIGLVLPVVLLGLAQGACIFWNADRDSKRVSIPSGVPEEAKNLANPVHATADSIAAGKVLFLSACVDCHGARGDGSGELARELGLKMGNFVVPTNQRTDGELFYILTEGHGGMAGQGQRWSDDRKWNLVNYIVSLRQSK